MFKIASVPNHNNGFKGKRLIPYNRKAVHQTDTKFKEVLDASLETTANNNIEKASPEGRPIQIASNRYILQAQEAGVGLHTTNRGYSIEKNNMSEIKEGKDGLEINLSPGVDAILDERYSIGISTY